MISFKECREIKDFHFKLTGINIPSSKNSKIWTGRSLIDNKPTQRFRSVSALWFRKNCEEFKKCVQTMGEQYPYVIGLYFYRDSKRRFDYINASQIIFDMMTEYLWIEDDSVDYVIPFFLGFEVTKKDESGFKLVVIPKEEYLKLQIPHLGSGL